MERSTKTDTSDAASQTNSHEPYSVVSLNLRTTGIESDDDHNHAPTHAQTPRLSTLPASPVFAARDRRSQRAHRQHTRQRKLLIAALAAAPLLVVAAIVCVALVADGRRRETLLIVVPPHAASIIASLLVVASIALLPEVRTLHTEYYGALALSQLWYSSFAIAFAASANCYWHKVSLAGWAASWLWSMPTAIDFVLMRRWIPEGSRARLAVSRGGHLAWPIAAALCVPIYTGPMVLVIHHGAVDIPSCTHAVTPTRFLPFLSFYVLSMFVNLVGHLAGACGAVDGSVEPAPQHRRHNLSALVLCLSLGVCTALTMTQLWFDTLSRLRQEPPSLLVWVALLGSSMQGVLIGGAYLLAAPGTIRALCDAPPPPLDVQREQEQRHVHFRGSEPLLRSGRETRRSRDTFDRLIAEQRESRESVYSQARAPLRWWWLIVPTAVLGVVVTLVWVLQEPL